MATTQQRQILRTASISGTTKTGLTSLETDASGSSRKLKKIPKPLRTAKSVGYGRLIFILGLAVVAAGLVGLAFYLSKQSSLNVAQGRFESVAERALVIASLRIEEKKYSANALAYMAAASNPNAKEWPNVVIPGYQNIAGSLRNVTQGEKMVFCPLIHHPGSEEQAHFEEFAYHHIHNDSDYHQHGGISSFGEGIWSIGDEDAPDKRYHDITGETEWNSPHNIIVPAFQFDEGDHPLMMKNLHQIPNMGRTMDDVIHCSIERDEAGDLRECGSLTDFVWTAEAEHHADEEKAVQSHDMGHHDGEAEHHNEGGHHDSEEHNGEEEEGDMGHHDGEVEHHNEGGHHDSEEHHGEEEEGADSDHHHLTRRRTAEEDGHEDDEGRHDQEHKSHHGDEGHEEHNDLAHGHGHGHGHGGSFGGPEAAFVIPIYPQLDNTKLSGFILAKLIWEEVLAHGFASDVTGLLIVLSTGEDIVHTFDVNLGVVKHLGEGDHFHDPDAKFYMEYVINNPAQFNDLTPTYLMEIYSTQEFIESYSDANNPWIFLIPAIILIPTILFFLYDLYVRKEFNSKRNLFEAKRQFVRYISHEVRTPLNTVLMGMALLRDDFASALGMREQNKKSRGEGVHTGATGTLADSDSTASRTSDRNIEQLEDWILLSSQISENAEAAVNILTDLLNYDKIQMGTLTLEYAVVPIWNVIEKTFSEFKIAAMEKKIKFVLDFGPLCAESKVKRSSSGEEGSDRSDYESSDYKICSSPNDIPTDIRSCKVIGDNIRLSQVLRNLISNGLKFSRENGQLIVRVSENTVSKRWKNHVQGEIPFDANIFSLKGEVVVDVIDDGVGMTPEQVKTVFNDGTQFNANKLQAGGGSGLGLNIAKGISEQHQGSLKCSSLGLERGTTFTLSLPLYEKGVISEEILMPRTIPDIEDTEVGDTEHDDSPENTSIDILVVDDSITNRKLCIRLLEKHGHTCVGAADGTEAVEVVEEREKEGKPFDCILLDYEMPLMNGPDACKEMRHMGCSSYIVGVTGNLMSEDLQHFRECGANWVLPKPFRMEALEQQLVESGVIGTPCMKQASDDTMVRVESGTALEGLDIMNRS